MEVKCYDQSGAWRPDNVGIWGCLNDISPGYTFKDRIGSQVFLRKIELYASISWGNAHTSLSQIRIMMFLDRQCKGVNPTLAEMFSTVTTTYLEFEPFNWLYMDRFIPIYDENFAVSLSYGGASVGNDPTQYIKFSADLGIVTNYKGTAGSVTDIADNGIFLYAYANDATGSVNVGYFNWWTRLLYNDQ